MHLTELVVFGPVLPASICRSNSRSDPMREPGYAAPASAALHPAIAISDSFAMSGLRTSPSGWAVV
jgi:hypothetical protein